MSQLQYSPCLNTLLLKNTNIVVYDPTQRICEYIHQVVRSWDLVHDEVTVVNALSYVMMVNVNVFHTSIVFHILGESNCTCIVPI